MGTGQALRDDRVLTPTRWISLAIVPVLIAAFVILYGFPGRTRQLWAWTMAPDMTALFMGAGYLAGAYFFVRVVRARRWHEVGAGLVGITVFSSVLLAATIRHWDRFNHDHVSFVAWLVLYGSTPFLLPWLWATNRRTDPGGAGPAGVVVPRALRTAVGIGGCLQLGFSAAMFFIPSSIISAWPWPLTPLTARSLSAFIAFPAVGWVWFLVEERWSALRVLQQVVTLGFALILLASLRARDDFRPGRLGPYLAGLVVALGMTVALQLAMDRRA